MGIRYVCGGLLPLFVLVGLFTLPMTGNSRAEEPKQVPLPHQVLFDFETPRDDRKWDSVNDGVMGGRSEGTFRVNRKGILEFYGNLSLENRGGFASVRSKPAKLDLSKTDALVIRFRGDGRTYYCNLYVPTNRTAYSYRARFDTKAERWQEVRLPLKSFQA
ncbi:MAG: CIA30 family protein, partial [Planctomycetota bacterium]